MGYACYRISRDRWGGYGVPAWCGYPGCSKKIDRGMAYACGEEPFSEIGCDDYFCEKHREVQGFKMNGESFLDYLCDHEEDCDCTFKEVCFSCSGKEQQYPYGYPTKPEHHDWLKHQLKDKSWAEWRKENPEKVEAYKVLLRFLKKPRPKKESNKPLI